MRDLGLRRGGHRGSKVTRVAMYSTRYISALVVEKDPLFSLDVPSLRPGVPDFSFLTSSSVAR